MLYPDKNRKYENDYRKRIRINNNDKIPPRIICSKTQYEMVIGVIRQYVGENVHIEGEMPMFFELKNNN
tara:strand:+ start:272 stop:478 length:207 start_codon:yes stop_codon:yes gene_type:complete